MLFDNVKALADKKGMSIGELERKAGLSNGAIFKWKVSIPKVDSVISVANVLHVKVDKLLEEKEKTPSGANTQGYQYTEVKSN